MNGREQKDDASKEHGNRPREVARAQFYETKTNAERRRDWHAARIAEANKRKHLDGASQGMTFAMVLVARNRLQERKMAGRIIASDHTDDQGVPMTNTEDTFENCLREMFKNGRGRKAR